MGVKTALRPLHRKYADRRRARRDTPRVSYANPDDPALRRLLIHAIEQVTGQPRLTRLYREYRREGDPAGDFWHAAVSKLRLKVLYDLERLAAIPRQGPLVIIANHPYGVLDGIVIGYLTSLVRPQFKLLAHSVLYRAPELQSFVLPIDFADSKAAIRTNLDSRRQASAELAKGGAVVIFPAGGVSTSKTLFGPAVDLEWKPFAAKLITQSRATVVPVFFEGQNSRLFQVASHISGALREGLLIKEVASRIGADVRPRIGAPIPYDALAHLRDRQPLVDHLRAATMDLGRRPGAANLA